MAERKRKPALMLFGAHESLIGRVVVQEAASCPLADSLRAAHHHGGKPAATEPDLMHVLWPHMGRASWGG